MNQCLPGHSRESDPLQPSPQQPPSLADKQVPLLWGGGGRGGWDVENEPVKWAGTPLH